MSENSNTFDWREIDKAQNLQMLVSKSPITQNEKDVLLSLFDPEKVKFIGSPAHELYMKFQLYRALLGSGDDVQISEPVEHYEHLDKEYYRYEDAERHLGRNGQVAQFVIDEFKYLVKTDSSLLSKLQGY